MSKNFSITKYLKQEVDDNLYTSVDEQSLCITGDIKIHLTWSKSNVTTHNGEVPYQMKELLLLPKFDNSSPFVTRYKEIWQSHIIMS